VAKHNFKLGDEVVYNSFGYNRSGIVVTFEKMNSLRGTDPIGNTYKSDDYAFVHFHVHIDMYHDATPVRQRGLKPFHSPLRVKGNTLYMEEV